MFFVVSHAIIAAVFTIEILLAHPCIARRHTLRPSFRFFLVICGSSLIFLSLACIGGSTLYALPPLFAFVSGFVACTRRSHAAIAVLTLTILSMLGVLRNRTAVPSPLSICVVLIDTVCVLACVRNMIRNNWHVRRSNYSMDNNETEFLSADLLAEPSNEVYGSFEARSSVHDSSAGSDLIVQDSFVNTVEQHPFSIESFFTNCASYFYRIYSRLPISLRSTLSATVDFWDAGEDDVEECVDNATRTVPPNLRTASLFGILGFHWMNPLVVLGRTQNLEMDNMPTLASHLRSLATGPEKFEKIWLHEVIRGGDYRLWRALARAFGGKLLLGGVLKLLNDICVFLSPLILQRVIRHLQYASTHPNESHLVRKGVLLSTSLMIVFLSQSLFFQHYFGNNIAVQAQVQGSLITSIYSKSVRLSAEARSHFASGFIHNLMATDSRTLADLTLYLHTMWSGAEQIVISLILLVGMLGILPTVAGIALILLSIPVQKELIGLTRRVREQASAWTDDRVKSVSEAVSNMQIVKLMSWESSFIKRITDARLGELKLVRLALNVQAATYGLVMAIPVGLSLVTFGTFALVGGVLDAAVVFPAIALFSVLRAPMLILPATMISIARSAAAVNRIQRFLDAEELKSLEDSPEHAVNNNAFEESDADIIAVNGSFSWNIKSSGSRAPTLSDISCFIPAKSLTCIVGPTAAGKSTFLSAVLGEVEIITGRIGIRPDKRTALCSQTPFIRNSTLRDNILFGLPFEKDRYRKTVQVCNLLPDLLTLPAGDLTEIGDRGTNLSGGQKARVSLARAVYSQHEIVVMDAPLAAVDTHVARSIFENCIVKEMEGRTRLMTTNSMNFASSPFVDYLVVLKDGKMVEFGKRDELISDSSSHFARMLATESDGDVIQEVDRINTDGISVHEGIDNMTELSSTTVADGSESKTTAITSLGVAITGHDERGIKDASELQAEKEKGKVGSVTEADRNRRGELFRREAKEVGKVKQRHYVEYMNACGGINWAVVIVSLAVLSQTLSIGVNVWLSFWSERSRVQSEQVVSAEQTRNLLVYSALCVGTILVTAAQMFVLASASVRASVWLHEKLVLSVFGAPMRFFDTTPTGRIVNRFNASIDRIDNSIIFSIRSVLGLTLTLLSTMLLILVTLPSFIFVLIPAAFVFFLIREYFRRTVIDLRRLESVSRSPLYSHFSETLDGVTTIRSYGASSRMMTENRSFTDKYITTTFASSSCNRWLSLRLEAVTSALVFGVSTIAVLSYRTVSPELSGLALSYAMQVVSSLGWYVRQLTETESYFSSIEQVSEYTTTPPFLQEEKLDPNSTHHFNISEVESLKRNQSWGLVSENLVRKILFDMNRRPGYRWPRRGHITFANVSMRYRPGLEPALNDLSMDILPGWHVGVVGRTGAGKSSLISTLFRLQEIEQGQITIDGQNIAQLPLRNLRRSLSVIAQEPVLFSGTIRSNLDMTGSYNDSEVQQAFDKSGLNETSSNELTLDSEVSEGGSNFSAGQRQLLCLGRALLRDSTVLVLDEATASLDDLTDRKLGETIRREMGHCTIITVAHRLHTVMQSTRICVLDRGQIVEYDEPRTLLERVPQSVFAQMVEETGPKTANFLRKLAYIHQDHSISSDRAPRTGTTMNNMNSLRNNALGALRLLQADTSADSNNWRKELHQNNTAMDVWKRSLSEMTVALQSAARNTLNEPSRSNISIGSVSNLAEIDVDPEDERHLNLA